MAGTQEFCVPFFVPAFQNARVGLQMARMQILLMLLLTAVLAGCAKVQPTAPESRSTSTRPESSFNQLADDYISGYLAWRPQSGTSLGLHQYDGKVTDFSQASIEAELKRL